MKKKEYKIKIENGEIKFFDEDESTSYQSKPVWEAFEEIMKDVPLILQG